MKRNCQYNVVGVKLDVKVSEFHGGMEVKRHSFVGTCDVRISC